MRIKRVAALLAVAFGIPGLGLGEEKGSGLIVHEWGVLIRQNTEPETLGPADAILDNLPAFVKKHTYQPQPVQPTVWRKPVLHFYGKEQAVSVKVMTPGGRPVAYWPTPFLIEQTVARREVKGGFGWKEAVGFHWLVNLTKEKPGSVVPAPEGHWWSKMREVDSLWVETRGTEGKPVANREAEKFLFYEGTGRSEPTVAARIEGRQMVLKNTDKEASGMVLVIANDGDNRYLAEVGDIAAGGEVNVDQKEMMADPVTREELMESARRQWVSFGMTEAEAKMIVSVWEEDLWQAKGFLVISRMPRHIYDTAIFPITIEPTPDELIRTALVFDTLPGLEGRIAWLPKIRVQIEGEIEGLGSPEPKIREASTANLAAFGDLAIEALSQAATEEGGDLEKRMRAQRLLGNLVKKPAPGISTPLNLPVSGRPGLILKR